MQNLHKPQKPDRMKEKQEAAQEPAEEPAQVLNLPSRRKNLGFQQDLCQRKGQNETQDKWETFPTCE